MSGATTVKTNNEMKLFPLAGLELKYCVYTNIYDFRFF